MCVLLREASRVSRESAIYAEQEKLYMNEL